MADTHWINARDLQAALNIKMSFHSWFKYHNTIDEKTKLPKYYDDVGMYVRWKRTGGRMREEYILTIKTAKEIIKRTRFMKDFVIPENILMTVDEIKDAGFIKRDLKDLPGYNDFE